MAFKILKIVSEFLCFVKIKCSWNFNLQYTIMKSLGFDTIVESGHTPGWNSSLVANYRISPEPYSQSNHQSFGAGSQNLVYICVGLCVWINPSHKSHNASDTNIPQCTMLCAHFCYKMLQCSRYDWCIAGFVQQGYWFYRLKIEPWYFHFLMHRNTDHSVYKPLQEAPLMLS